MILFSLTGLLLNHQLWVLGEVKNTQFVRQIPPRLIENWEMEAENIALPILVWMDQQHDIRGVSIEYEWDDIDQLLLINLDGPNGAHSIEISPEEGSATVFSRELPMLEMLNNLHRGKHVSPVWRLIIDASAVFMLLFSITGLWLTVINRNFRAGAITCVVAGLVTSSITIYLMF